MQTILFKVISYVGKSNKFIKKCILKIITQFLNDFLQDITGERFKLSESVEINVQQFNNIPITPDAGRFICALMSNLLTTEEMRQMSLTGGSCYANHKNNNIVQKIPLPLHIKTAVVGKSSTFLTFRSINKINILWVETTKRYYNISEEAVLKKIGVKLGNMGIK